MKNSPSTSCIVGAARKPLSLKARLKAVARLHAMTVEMADIAKQLRASGIDVRVRPTCTAYDPLAQVGSFVITMDTGCDFERR